MRPAARIFSISVLDLRMIIRSNSGENQSLHDAFDLPSAVTIRSNTSSGVPEPSTFFNRPDCS